MVDEVDQATQKDLTGLSTNSKQIMATINQHILPEYKPDEVVASILELLNMVASK